MAKTKIIKPHAGFQESFVRTNVDVCFAGGVLNAGKAQPLYSKILTPYGFTTMGEITVGSIICDTEGKTQRVEAVYERGIRDCYRITFSNGASVDCCDEHLWDVYDTLKCDVVTIELSQIIKNPKRYRLYLPKEVHFNQEKKLPIHPYLLGVIIGSGGYADGENSLTISTYLECILRAQQFEQFEFDVQYSNDTKPTIYIHSNHIRKVFEEFGLYKKQIPKEFLLSSIENRKELLRGLFDARAYNYTTCNRIDYETNSEQLSNDVVFLIRSLGGYAHIGSCNKAFFRIGCTFEHNEDFFTLKEKKRRASRLEPIVLSFDNINHIGKEQMRCIQVSSNNHLYITDDFIMTHNTAGAVLMCAEPSLDPNFRAVFLRNNLGDLRSGGGILDEFRNMYRNGCTVVESGEPRVEFPSGARVDVTHIADQSRDKVRQRFKGRQYDLIYFDEMTGFTWECFVEVCTRNRGRGKWTGKIRGTTNPDRNHWLRTFLDWYIGADGFIREDRDGVVRYFYIAGESVKDVVWGDSKEEVYHLCKSQIDRQLARINGRTGHATYKDMIRSFTFYLGRMTENTDSIDGNKGYVGAVAMSGGRNAQQLLEGNWNVSPEDALDAPIPADSVNQVFLSDPKRNGDKWITADLADTGTDNFLALAWDGFHIFDCLILNKSTPRMNAENLDMFAKNHNIPPSHIIYDAVRGTYINDYIPEAIPFISYHTSVGLYGRMAYNLKSECYLRLAETIKRENLSIEEKIADRIYEHQNLRNSITIRNEFIEECAVVRFKDMPNGKKSLCSKKEMNAKLGKSRSMDLLDPCAMRMFPVLEYPYGEELEKTANFETEENKQKYGHQYVNIYDNTIWGA